MCLFHFISKQYKAHFLHAIWISLPVHMTKLSNKGDFPLFTDVFRADKKSPAVWQLWKQTLKVSTITASERTMLWRDEEVKCAMRSCCAESHEHTVKQLCTSTPLSFYIYHAALIWLAGQGRHHPRWTLFLRMTPLPHYGQTAHFYTTKNNAAVLLDSALSVLNWITSPEAECSPLLVMESQQELVSAVWSKHR